MTLARTATAVLVALVALALLWLRGMRDKQSAVARAQRRFNRDRMNPRQRATAGTAGSGTALVRHTGRRSGRTYETPVDVVRTDDGFVVGMVYGRNTDWAQNLLAGGPAAVVHDGREHTVEAADVVTVDEVADVFTPGQRRLMRVFAVREALRVRAAP